MLILVWDWCKGVSGDVELVKFIKSFLTVTSRARVPKKGEDMDVHKKIEKRANTI
jgi:hypothetical protein